MKKLILFLLFISVSECCFALERCTFPITLDFEGDENCPVIICKEGRFLFDTGCSGNILNRHWIVRKFGSLDSFFKEAGIENDEKVYDFKLGTEYSLNLDDSHDYSSSFCFFIGENTRRDGLIGNPVFEKIKVVTIDYRNKRIIFNDEKLETKNNLPMKTGEYGLVLLLFFIYEKKHPESKTGQNYKLCRYFSISVCDNHAL